MSQENLETASPAKSAPVDRPERPASFSKKLPINIQRIWGDGEMLHLRWPTDAEWIEADRKVKSITQPAGRNATETTWVGQESANEYLARRINANGLEMSENDAMEVADLLSFSEVEKVERDGRTVTVEMYIVGDLFTRHRLRVPTKQEARAHARRAIGERALRGNRVETCLHLDAYGEYYDTLLADVEGYETREDIPIIHKRAAIVAMLDSVENMRRETNAVFFG